MRLKELMNRLQGVEFSENEIGQIRCDGMCPVNIAIGLRSDSKNYNAAKWAINNGLHHVVRASDRSVCRHHSRENMSALRNRLLENHKLSTAGRAVE